MELLPTRSKFVGESFESSTSTNSSERFPNGHNVRTVYVGGGKGKSRRFQPI